MGGRSVARRRVGGILRATLRSPLRAVLRGCLRMVLRNQEIRRVERVASGGQETAWRVLRRSCSASDSTFVTTEWWTPVLSAITFFRLSDSDNIRMRATVFTGCRTALLDTIRSASATNSGAGVGAPALPCGAVEGAGRGVAGASGEVERGAGGAATGAVEGAGRGAVVGAGRLLSWGCAARGAGAPTFIRAAMGAVKTSPLVAPNTDKSMTAGASAASAGGTPRVAVKE